MIVNKNLMRFITIVAVLMISFSAFAAEKGIHIQRQLNEKNNGFVVTEKDDAITITVPVTLEKKDLKTLEKNTGEATQALKDIGKKLDGVVTGIVESKNSSDKTTTTVKEMGKANAKAINDLAYTTKGMWLTLGAILLTILLVLLLFYFRRNQNSELQAMRPTNEIGPGKAATEVEPTNRDILEEIKNIGNKIKEIPADTATLTDMWLIPLKNVGGHNVDYYAPLIDGKRRSLRVPNDLTGEYPNPAEIPRVAREKRTDMKSSVAATLKAYLEKDYAKGSLQRRVVEYAIRDGQVVGINILQD
jgi:hypothetical protein